MKTCVRATVRRKPQTATMVQGQVWAKELEDGSHAVGLFNAGKEDMKVVANWADVKVDGKQVVRDLWRQKDLGEFEGKFEATVAPHGVVLVKLSSVK